MISVDRLSPSALDRFRACPKQFYLSDIERAPREAETSTVLMQGNAIHAALEKFYGEKKTLTRDVGGTTGTKEFADSIIAALESPVAASR